MLRFCIGRPGAPLQLDMFDLQAMAAAPKHVASVETAEAASILRSVRGGAAAGHSLPVGHGSCAEHTAGVAAEMASNLRPCASML
jgi:hypothetical protein